MIVSLCSRILGPGNSNERSRCCTRECEKGWRYDGGQKGREGRFQELTGGREKSVVHVFSNEHDGMGMVNLS